MREADKNLPLPAKHIPTAKLAAVCPLHDGCVTSE
ncbi:MAG: hypothetical protein JWM91_1702 [Rhodospirillales bacterium]|nr:hypothetical protein [Rhodospirillales bacterium]